MKTSQPTTTKKTSRSRLFLRVGIGVVMAIIVSGWFFYRSMTSPQRIARLAESYLQTLTTGDVKVGSASFSWMGGVQLMDVKLHGSTHETDADETATTAPLFSCRKIELSQPILSLIFGKPGVASITAWEPTLTIVRDAQTGKTNLTGLIGNLMSMENPYQSSELTLPTIELRDANVRVFETKDQSTRQVEDLKLTLRGRPAGKGNVYYDIVWGHQTGSSGGGHSRIELTTGRIRNVRGGLPPMSIEAVLIAVNARYDQAGTWSDLLGLGGTVRVKDYLLGGSENDPTSRSATIALLDASLSIPIDDTEAKLEPNQRYLQFEQVNGEVEITPTGIDAVFTGLLHGSRCRVRARMVGGMSALKSLDDVDFEVQLDVDALVLPRSDEDAPPAEARFVNRWAPVRKFFRDFSPSGPVDIVIDARKSAGADQPIRVSRLFLDALGGQASARFLPYRVHDLRGSVELTPDGLFINNVRGQHFDGTVSVNGWMEKPSRLSPADITIRGQHLLIDEDLCDAVPEAYRKITEQFMPQGWIDVELELLRPQGQGDLPGKWVTRCTVGLDDVSARFVGFPYEVDALSGQLIAEAGRLNVMDVTGRRGVTRIALNGTVSWLANGGETLDLHVRAHNLLYDDAFSSALPANLRAKVAAFAPSGSFDLESQMSREGSDLPLRHVSTIQLNGMSMRYDQLPVDVNNVQGRLRITPSVVIVENVTGMMNGAHVTINGHVGGDQEPDLSLQVSDLTLTQQIQSALPQTWREAVHEWTIDGKLAIDATLRPQPDEENTTAVWTVDVFADDVLARHSRFPIPFEHVHGRLFISQDGLKINEITAQYGSASVAIGGTIRRTHDSTEATFNVNADNLKLDVSLRDALGPELGTTWDRLKPTGTVDLQLNQLQYVWRNGAPTWSVEGTVVLQDVSLASGLRLEHVNGAVMGSGMLADRHGGSSLEGYSELRSISFHDQPLERLRTGWSYLHAANGLGHFSIDSLAASLHGGMVSGNASVAFGPEHPTYQVSGSVRGINLQPLLRDVRPTIPTDERAGTASGKVDGQFFLSGTIGDNASRRGRGRLEIKNGHFVRLPLMLAILNVVNLVIPNERSTDSAGTDFLIEGNRVTLENINVQSKLLLLAGYGVMTLPDRGLDLTLMYQPRVRTARIPVLADVVEGTARELIQLRITGPASQPKVRATPLGSLNRELRNLFRRKPPSKAAASPSG